MDEMKKLLEKTIKIFNSHNYLQFITYKNEELISKQEFWKNEFEHCHDDYVELVILIKGEFILTFNNNAYSIKKPAIVFIPKNILHHERPVKTKKDYLAMWFIVKRNKLVYWFSGYNNTINIYPEIFSTRHIYPKIDNSNINYIINNFYYKDKYEHTYLINLLHNYLIMLYKSDINDNDEKNNKQISFLMEKAIKNAISIIDKNINKQISISDLAQSVGYSSDYFSKIFKKINNISPINYINNKKMEHACKLLSDSNMKIREIALSLGYYNINHFNIYFKKIMKITPGNFRNKLK